MRGPRSFRLAAAVLAATGLAVAGLIAFWWRQVPAFEGPQTFLALKGELATVAMTPVPGGACEVRYDIELRSSRGWSVRGHLRVPTCAGAPLPGIVILGGIRTGRQAAALVRVPEPHVVLGLDYPWDGPRRLGLGGMLVRLPEIRRAVLTTPASLVLAADYLAKGRTDVRGDSLILIGASLGVPFAAAAAAIDERFATVALVYGGGDLPRLIDANFRRAHPQVPAWLARIGALVAAPVEPVRYVGAITPRRLVMVNGLGDERVPVECVDALYAAAKEPKQLVWLETSHITPRDQALLQAIIDATINALDSLPSSERDAAAWQRSGTAAGVAAGWRFARVTPVAASGSDVRR